MLFEVSLREGISNQIYKLRREYKMTMKRSVQKFCHKKKIVCQKKLKQQELEEMVEGNKAAGIEPLLDH